MSEIWESLKSGPGNDLNSVLAFPVKRYPLVALFRAPLWRQLSGFYGSVASVREAEKHVINVGTGVDLLMDFPLRHSFHTSEKKGNGWERERQG